MCSSSPGRTPKLQLTAEQPSRRMLDPTRKRYPTSKAKEKPQQDGRRGEIALESNPIPSRNTGRAQTKPCVHQDPEAPQRLNQTCLGINISSRGIGQQWPASRTGALGSADVGHTACGISLLGGGRYYPHHKATKQMTHRLQNNYTKEILTVLRKF